MSYETDRQINNLRAKLRCKANCGSGGSYEFENGLYNDNNVVKLGGELIENTSIDINGKYLLLGNTDFLPFLVIGDGTPLGGDSDIIYMIANNTTSISENNTEIATGNDAFFNVGNDVFFDVDNNAFFDAGNDAFFNAGNDAFFNAGNNAFFNAGNAFSVGAYYVPNPSQTQNIRILFDGSNKRISLDDVNLSVTTFITDFNSGNVLLPTVVNFNFPNDIAAAGGGVDVNGLYHDNGVLRIRIS